MINVLIIWLALICNGPPEKEFLGINTCSAHACSFIQEVKPATMQTVAIIEKPLTREEFVELMARIYFHPVPHFFGSCRAGLLI